jgi:hypothetical protein
VGERDQLPDHPVDPRGAQAELARPAEAGQAA